LKSTASSINRAQSVQGNPLIPHVVNKYRLVFLHNEHAKQYEAIVTSKIYTINYIDEQILETSYLLDDLHILLGILS